MLSILAVRRAAHHLRRPFIQRLITLVISMLLAGSLISIASVPALPPPGHEVASSALNQFAQPVSAAHLEVAHIQSLMPKMHAHGYASATQQYDTERRLI